MTSRHHPLELPAIAGLCKREHGDRLGIMGNRSRWWRPSDHEPYRQIRGLDGHHWVEVLDVRHWVVKVMQQLPPFLVGVRFTKSNRVILKLRPFHQQEIGIGTFDATREVDSLTALRGLNDGDGSPEGSLELSFLASANRQDRLFQNHVGSLSPRRPGNIGWTFDAER